MRFLGVVAFVFLPCAGMAATLHVGTTWGYAEPSKAIAFAEDGDVIQIQPGRYTDCAVVRANNVTIEGVGPADGVVITDKPCEGKGLLIIDGNNVTVRNLTLTRARVPDGNGAGIREEGQNLTVDGVRFINNQDGLLADVSPQSTILVRNSLFYENGICLEACAHGIYANRIALLRVVHSRFLDTIDGHSIKSRAARTEVLDSDIGDGPNGTSSYLIEAPNGGALLVRGNTLEKGPRTGNSGAAISIGAEGVDQPTPEITVENNRFANDSGRRTAMVYNMTLTPAKVYHNQITGPVDPLAGAGTIN